MSESGSETADISVSSEKNDNSARRLETTNSSEAENPQDDRRGKHEASGSLNSSATKKRKVFASLQKKWNSFKRSDSCEYDFFNETNVDENGVRQCQENEQGAASATASNDLSGKSCRPLPPLPTHSEEFSRESGAQDNEQAVYTQVESRPRIRFRSKSFTSGLFEKFGNLHVRPKRTKSTDESSERQNARANEMAILSDSEDGLPQRRRGRRRRRRPDRIDLMTGEIIPGDPEDSESGLDGEELRALLSENAMPMLASDSCERPPPLPPRSRPGEPVLSDDEDDSTPQNLAEGLKKLSRYGWYWGPLSRKEANKQLKGKPYGSFLVRDSEDDSDFLILSFRASGRSIHTTIEYQNGKFSFYPMPLGEGEYSVVRLIKRSMAIARHGQYLLSLGKIRTNRCYQVKLLYPISRFTNVPSLLQMCRFSIRDNIRVDQIDKLPLPKTLIKYLEENFFNEE